jgi:hypothetical protein
VAVNGAEERAPRGVGSSARSAGIEVVEITHEA